MGVIGQVESLWRHPVKSMRGEELPEIFAGFAGIYGDRLFAFKSSAAPPGFPYLTGREQHEMLLYRPRFRYPERAAKPPNVVEAEASLPASTLSVLTRPTSPWTSRRRRASCWRSMILRCCASSPNGRVTTIR
jgi:uncharacterized protein YcbX